MLTGTALCLEYNASKERKRGCNGVNDGNDKDSSQSMEGSPASGASPTWKDFWRKWSKELKIIAITFLLTAAMTLVGRSIVLNVFENPADIKVLNAEVTGKLDGLEKDLTGKFEILDGKITGNFDVLEERLASSFDKANILIDGVSSDVQNILGELEDLREKDDYLEELFGSAYKNFASETNISGIVITATPKDDFRKSINLALNGRDNPGKSAKVELLSDTVIASDEKSGAPWTVDDLAHYKVLLPYLSGNQEVFFYGQINEKGCWDGNCILNVYEDNKLVLITDAVYVNGNLLNFKQVFFYSMGNDQSVWAYADRQSKKNFSTGETWLYTKEKEDDCFKDFGLDDVTADKILTADGFREKIDKKKVAYYCGNTSDGYFNDTTGNAYMIHYYDDGAVRILYSGNFVNGFFNDNTGNAWYIVRDPDKLYDYMCYKGRFADNREVDSKRTVSFPPSIRSYSPKKLQEFQLAWKDSKTPVYIGKSLTLDDIHIIMGGRRFDGDIDSNSDELDWDYLTRPTI